jgi:hypothetical protein
MKPSRWRRQSPLLYAGVGASVLAAPAGAGLAAPSAQALPSPGIHARPEPATVAYGHRVVVVGRAPASQNGQTVTLQFTPFGQGDWRRVAGGAVRADGSFRLVAWLSRSGWVRVIPSPPAAAGAAMIPPASATVNPSQPRRVAVAAALRVRRRSIEVFEARTIRVRGRLLPAAPWRRVLLQGEQDGRWRTLAGGWTTRRGFFVLGYRASGPGEEALRVAFAGDRANAPGAAPAGTLTGYQPTVASWYDDGGSTACGFHAYYGVANLSLPCGTRVEFVYGGRRVQAVVDDRGPYVGGRTWDLNQNTAAALGFGGVGTVFSSR